MHWKPEDIAKQQEANLAHLLQRALPRRAVWHSDKYDYHVTIEAIEKHVDVALDAPMYFSEIWFCKIAESTTYVPLYQLSFFDEG